MGKKRNGGISFHSLGAVSNMKMSFPHEDENVISYVFEPFMPFILFYSTFIPETVCVSVAFHG